MNDQNITKYTLEQIKAMQLSHPEGFDDATYEQSPEFEGQEYQATTLQQELAYNSLIQMLDVDLRPVVNKWNGNFSHHLNMAIRSYSRPYQPNA